eukprot:CAMPEP_0174232926 /NCGR_PEP_ID=MMETSP0417-20130205/3092_1 /TAXON_ID=242541 /ORGANISM="Mayorella sp, Strain BSH-02190019" /LENGTH=73 /DNA_ID=CAMNT_0015311059 /DNA_START=786 /DNA_END=1007 /DNA_ORIENTATION=-
MSACSRHSGFEDLLIRVQSPVHQSMSSDGLIHAAYDDALVLGCFCLGRQLVDQLVQLSVCLVGTLGERGIQDF